MIFVAFVISFSSFYQDCQTISASSEYSLEICQIRSMKINLAYLFICFSDPCKDNFGGCSQICLTTHNGNGGKDVVCDCSYGFTLQPDRKSCKSGQVYYKYNFFNYIEDLT